MRDIVFTRSSGWIPHVIREDGELKLTLGAGADANHEPRTFTFSISEAHLGVIQEDLVRHLLLWSAVLPLCHAAGTRGRLDENGAVALLDPILLAAPSDVDTLFRRIPWDRVSSSPTGPTSVCLNAVRYARRCARRQRRRTRNELRSTTRTGVAPSAGQYSVHSTPRF